MLILFFSALDLMWLLLFLLLIEYQIIIDYIEFDYIENCFTKLQYHKFVWLYSKIKALKIQKRKFSPKIQKNIFRIIIHYIDISLLPRNSIKKVS